MPKNVDHRQRRKEIADAVSRIAVEKGLQGVSFRHVASEAGVSVSLVQHYFGTKENLLIGTLEIQSAHLGESIASRLGQVDPKDSVKRLRVIARSFIPTDREAAEAMLVYHAFAGAALTDRRLRGADAFANATALTDAIAHELTLSQNAGLHRSEFDPTTEASVILALVLGLSLAVLLEQMTADEALAILDTHLNRLTSKEPPPNPEGIALRHA